MRSTGICCAAAVLLLISTNVGADPITQRPVSFGEGVDFAPIDGANLDLVVATPQIVALGPSAETRVFYQFAVPRLGLGGRPLTLSLTRGTEEFSECASLVPCPTLTRLDIFGFVGTGTVTRADYNAGSFLTSVDAIPARGRTMTVNVTTFISGLPSDDSAFAGFALRAGSFGALGFSDARLAATPEPGSLILLMLGGVYAFARTGRRCRA